MRQENDFLGAVEIDPDALYGIHSVRAKENFPDLTSFPIEWYKALGIVKRACYETYQAFIEASTSKYPEVEFSFPVIPNPIIQHLISSANEIMQGKHFEHFIVPAITGGAGTSINMNVNEIISNTSLVRMGDRPGNYSQIDPIEHANVFQSTNDVVPTALKVTLIYLLNDLEKSINELRKSVEEKEAIYRDDLRIGYTQMQEAVPTSFGKLFSTYSEALSRDWWRVSKCFERLKLINLGGGAIGTSLAIPRFFVMEVTAKLQQLTGLPVARSENLSDATSNLDAFVEVHAILKAHSVNLEKMVGDLRLLASDIVNSKIEDRKSKVESPTSSRQIILPDRQVGSSIMPGKVNPVIPEFVISAAHKIYANDTLITSLAAQGCLELNAYLPAIGCAMIESVKLMIAMDNTLKKNLFEGLKVNSSVALNQLQFSPSITTALIPFIGYHKASEIAKLMKEEALSVFDANDRLALLDSEKLVEIVKPENLLQLGYTLNQLIQWNADDTD